MKIDKKIGIDIHGVININPVFSELTEHLSSIGYEIHIITGPRLNYPYKTNIESFDKIEDELEKYKITYDVLFSVLDHNVENGSNVWKDERGWWTDTESWNKTKGEYCKENGILLHIDDTESYSDHFETPFGFLDNENKCIEISKIDNKSIIIQDILPIFEGKFKFKYNI